MDPPGLLSWLASVDLEDGQGRGKHRKTEKTAEKTFRVGQITLTKYYDSGQSAPRVTKSRKMSVLSAALGKLTAQTGTLLAAKVNNLLFFEFRHKRRPLRAHLDPFSMKNENILEAMCPGESHF